MIDTIKIYCEVSKDISQAIKNKSVVKSSVDYATGELQYEITNGHLVGSYDSRLSVKTEYGRKYNFCSKDGGYYVEIEGSYHKIIKGYNSHDGFYNIQEVCKNLIEKVEKDYNIKLPKLEKWFLQRCDIAITYDLKCQENVKNYINSMSRCTYPRRKAKFFYDESIYLSGTSTTLKIYNKYLEFKKHDIKKFINTEFDIIKYLNKIQGFVRFECEVKKKKLVDIYKNKDINIIDVKYEDLRNVWSDEFMKVIKLINNDLEIVRGREEVNRRLHQLYKNGKANRLYNFYCAIQLNGLNDVKLGMSSSGFYQDIKSLKEAKIDFSQTYKIDEENQIFWFNPFESKEVA